jgi:signal peptidase I
MRNTLQCDDRIFAQRWGQPNRGDIIVFHPPREPQGLLSPSDIESLQDTSGSIDTTYVKRLIARAGDEVWLKNGRTYLNGKALKEPYLHPETLDMDWGPILVPKGHVFVLGDNRAYSSDSRTFGFVPEENIRGTVVFRYWPINRAGSIPSESDGSDDGSSC